eukprot:307669-Prymnesium_polylepis.1
MEQLPGVFQACACVVQQGGAPTSLAGFIVLQQGAETPSVVSVMRTHLQSSLPSNLVPASL